MSDIFFDLDGTLINIQKRHYFVYKTTIELLGGYPLSRQVYWNLKKSKSNIKNILSKSKLGYDLVDRFKKEFFQKIETEANLKLDEVFPYTFLTLKALQALNYKLFLISFRHLSDNSLQQVRNLNLDKFFTDIKFGQISNNGCLTKTHFIKALKSAKGGYVVGDTEDDILAAEETGLTSIAVISGIRDLHQLKKYKPDYLIKNIEVIPSLLMSK